MRMAFAWILLFCVAVAHAETPPDFGAAIDANRAAIDVDGGVLSGAGAKRLLDEGRAADVFLFGENHGAHEIAAFADALYRGVSAGKPRRLVTEIGPATATELEAMLRAGTFRAFEAEGVHLLSVPFFFWEDELPLVEDAVKANPNAPAIWGLDQEFVAGAPVVLRRLDALATSAVEHDAVAATRRAAFWNPLLFGMGSGQPVKDLQAAFAASSSVEAKALTDQLELGFRIYQEQGDSGNWKWSNERRETLMMENFAAYVSTVADTPGPLFFKMGAFHLMRGDSPAVDDALGARISRWAAERGMTTLNVFVDCRGGELRDVILGRPVPCDSYLDGEADVFGAHLVEGSSTLFDLRPLRERAELAQMPKRVQRIVRNYDWFIVASNTHPSTFLPGWSVTRVYGGTIAAIVIVVLVLLIVWIVRRIRRWRRRRKLATVGTRSA